MKNAFLILLVAMPVFASAQFKLTPGGFVSAADTTKNYVVIDAPGVSQADLYKRTLIYLSKQFASPKDAISIIDNESITINSIDNVGVRGFSNFLVNYTINLEFKDDKLRVISPSLNRMYNHQNTLGLIGGRYTRTIFKDNGEVRLDKTKQSLELMFEAWIIRIKLGLEEGKAGNW